MSAEKMRAYWKSNIRILSLLLAIWFFVSFVAGILFVDELDQIRIGGFGLGFWIANQGAIYVFVGLIFAYVVLMNRLDKKYNAHENDEDHNHQI
ncbi:MAG: DUF4212 domain-containing protein [Verrucomicrobiota bacterium]